MEKIILFFLTMLVLFSCDISNNTGTTTTTAKSGTTPGNVIDLKAESGNTKSVLTWSDPTSDFSYIEITPIPSSATAPRLSSVTVLKGLNTETMTGLTNGVTYSFIVKTVNSDGNKSSGVAASAKAGFRVTYNGNGKTRGTVPTDATVYSPNDTVTIVTNSLERIPVSGVAEAFINRNKWNTSDAGTGTMYSGSATFTITDDVTLYAYWGNYVLTDIGPAGGYIFYDKGSFSDGWRYMEMSPRDQTADLVWGTYGTVVGVNCETAAYAAIGAGKTNTEKIVTTLGAGNTYAAGYCDALSLTYNSTVFDDWFLPSKEELYQVGLNIYWSNTGTKAKYSSTYGRYYNGGGLAWQHMYYMSNEGSYEPNNAGAYYWFDAQQLFYYQYGNNKAVKEYVLPCRRF